MTEWINCKDKLPNQETEVLLYYKSEAMGFEGYQIGYYYEEHMDSFIHEARGPLVGLFLDENGEHEVENVTHWRKLEPPTDVERKSD